MKRKRRRHWGRTPVRNTASYVVKVAVECSAEVPSERLGGGASALAQHRTFLFRQSFEEPCSVPDNKRPIILHTCDTCIRHAWIKNKPG